MGIIKDTLKVNRKTFINPRGWLGYDAVKEETKTTYGLFRTVFFPEKSTIPKETFEEALTRLNMTQEEADNVSLNYWSFAVFFALCSVVLIGFAIYLLTELHLLGFLLAIAITAVMLAQAFRCHFYHFQIKHRKLGCTFEEWRQGRTKEEGAQ